MKIKSDRDVLGIVTVALADAARARNAPGIILLSWALWNSVPFFRDGYANLRVTSDGVVTHNRFYLAQPLV